MLKNSIFLNKRWQLILFTIFGALTSFTNIAVAQIGRGCLVDGVLYTANTSAGNRYFYRNSGTLVTQCEFNPTGNSANCRLYNSGNINNNNSYTLYQDAFSNDWEELECPIDDNLFLLIIPMLGLCVVKLRFKV